MNVDIPRRRRLLSACALLPLVPLMPFAAFTPTADAARPARNALPLQLAQDAPADIDPAGHLVSEKLDGVRAYWDGQSLRFRSGLPVAAPESFLRQLPPVALDGELWLGRGRFEALSGLVRRAEPDEAGWRTLRYMVFDLPGAAGPYAQRARQLAALVQAQGAPALQAVDQAPVADRPALQRRLAAVLRAGGEGLMLHRADALHAPGRSAALLKLKPVQDADAVVLGQVSGRGRHAGRMGALRVQTPEGREFLLGTGFSDAERAAPPAVGSVVTYRHRGHTEGGLPRFASFLRERGP